MAKILVLATSRFTHGGISSVVMAHEHTQTWSDCNCRWIATHRSGSKWRKISYLLQGLAEFIVRLPSADIVHIHTGEPPSPLRKLLFMRIARMMGKKTIIHVHADPSTTIQGSHHKVFKKIFDISDRIIVLSQKWIDELRDNHPEYSNKTRILYNPCPEIKSEKTQSESDNALIRNYILFAGLLNANKGYEHLIRAFAKISSRHPDWHLVLAGSGEIDKARELSAELGVADKVELCGWISGDKKDLLFRNASVFCLPSFAEGFPMAVLEAWAYGLPVVATPVGGLPEVVEDGRDALLFPPGDVEKLASQLEKIISDEDLRKKIAASSTNLAKTTFNIKTVGARLAEIYAELA